MTQKGRLTGYHVLFMLLGFFGVMLAVNIIFTVFAVKTFPGEQEEKSYLQGINYNQKLENRAHQEALGWRSEIGLIRTGDAAPLLASDWFDKNGDPMIAMKVKAQLTRPASEEGQRRVELAPNGPGRYEVLLPALETGIWNVELTAESPDGETATAHKSLTWER